MTSSTPKSITAFPQQGYINVPSLVLIGFIFLELSRRLQAEQTQTVKRTYLPKLKIWASNDWFRIFWAFDWHSSLNIDGVTVVQNFDLLLDLMTSSIPKSITAFPQQGYINVPSLVLIGFIFLELSRRLQAEQTQTVKRTYLPKLKIWASNDSNHPPPPTPTPHPTPTPPPPPHPHPHPPHYPYAGIKVSPC